MNERIRRWLIPYVADEDRARRQYLLNVIVLGGMLLAIPSTIYGLFGWLTGSVPANKIDVLASVGAFGILFVAYGLSRWGRIWESSVLIVGLALVLPSAYIYLAGDPYDPVLIFYSVAVIFAGLLLSVWGSVVVAALVAILHIGLVWYAHVTLGVRLQWLSWIAVAGAAGLIVLGVWLYVRQTDRVLARLRQQAQDLQAADLEKGYLVEDLQALTAQQRGLLDLVGELADPILPVQEGVIVLPLIGHVDEARATRAVAALLEGIAAHRARVAVVDVTGLPTMDTMLARSLMQMTQGAQLLGAVCVLSGVRAQVAHTLSRLDVELDTLITSADLQSGIEIARRIRDG